MAQKRGFSEDGSGSRIMANGLAALCLVAAAMLSSSGNLRADPTAGTNKEAPPKTAAAPQPASPAAHEPPILTVDSFELPEFRGTLPGQPREVLHLVLGQWQTNCYVLIGATKKAIVIDPADWLNPLPQGKWDLTGQDSSTLLTQLRLHGVDVKYIISTHGHLDHVSGAKVVKDAYHCTFCMNGGDIDADGRPKDSHYFPGGLPKVDRRLQDGDEVECDGIRLKVIFTPGHSPGSICMLCGNWLFTGDTLFYRTVGRTNFLDGSGNMDLELRSIRTRLYTLPPATLVLPGHFRFTTIGDEKAENPWTNPQPP